jgi:hypothetical protein
MVVMEIAFHEYIEQWNRNPYTALESDEKKYKKHIKCTLEFKLAIASR